MPIYVSMIIGAVFLILGLLIAVFKSNLSPTAKWIIRVMVALGAGFLSAGLLGFIDVGGSIPGWTIQAGGGFAIFVLVYLLNPPSLFGN